MKDEPVFAMSMYASRADLYKAKAEWYEGLSTRWEEACKNEAKQCTRHQRASLALQEFVDTVKEENNKLFTQVNELSEKLRRLER